MASQNSSNGDLIHVSSYTRDDGTQVDDYYRHRAGGGSFVPDTSIGSGSSNLNIADSVSNVLGIVGSKKSFDEECPALAKLFGGVSKASDVPNPIPVLEGGVEVFKIALEKVVKVAVKVLEVALPVAGAIATAYFAGKAIYDKVTGLFSSHEVQVQYNTLQTTIQGLRETQKLQKKNLGKLSTKTANTKNKEEYANLFQELAKQKAEYQKNEVLLSKIEYAFDNHDYESLSKGLADYQQNQTSTINGNISTMSTESNSNSAFEYSKQELPYKLENAYNSFGNNYAKPFDIRELESLQDKQLSSLPDNSLLKEFLNQNNQLQGATDFRQAQQSFLPEEINTLLKSSISKTELSFFDNLQSQLYMNALKNIFPIASGNLKNSWNDFEEARKTIGTFILNGLDDIKNKDLNAFLKKLKIPVNARGVAYSANTELAQRLANSPEIKKFVAKNYKQLLNGQLKSASINYDVSFGTDSFDRYAGFQHVTLYNPKIDEFGNFSAFLIDYYDFTERNPKNPLNIPNNWGYKMQQLGNLEKQFYLVYIYTKI